MGSPRGRELTWEEALLKSIRIEGVQTGEVDEWLDICLVTIHGHPEVEMVRVRPPADAWFRAHEGDTVTLDVYPYKWAIGEHSGTVYYFLHGEVVE